MTITLIAVWDLDVPPTGAQYTLGNLFPEKSAPPPFYALEFPEYTGGDPQRARLIEGGYFTSAYVAVDSVIQAAPGEAAIYFTAPVSSPDVTSQAIYTLSGNPKYISTLCVRASHWNGQQLSIKVDCSVLNGDDEVYLTWHPDSTYTADIANVTAADNTYYLPFRAEGTDGLLLYGEIEAVVDGALAQSFKDLN